MQLSYYSRGCSVFLVQNRKQSCPNCFSGHLNCFVLHSPAAQNHQESRGIADISWQQKAEHNKTKYFRCTLSWMAQQLPTPSGKLRAKSYLWGICETWLSSTGGSSTWESSALPRKAPGPPKFPMWAVLLLGQCGCDMCYLSNRDKSVLQL